MINSYLNKIVTTAAEYSGRSNYKVDTSISGNELFFILYQRSLQLLRGIFYKLFLINSKGGLFIGKGVRLKNTSKVVLGKNVILGDFVEINGLSKYGIVFGNNVTISKSNPSSMLA